MPNDLSQALNSFDNKKTTKINLMTAISKDISKNIEQGYRELSMLIGGGSKTRHTTKAEHIISRANQVNTTGEKREQKRIRKRDSTNHTL